MISKDDCRSLTCADESVDVIVDKVTHLVRRKLIPYKGTMDAFMRLEESESFQAMDEMARVLVPGGKILQLTEEPPETRMERWFKWSLSTKYEAKIQQEEIVGKFGYIVTLSQREQ